MRRAWLPCAVLALLVLAGGCGELRRARACRTEPATSFHVFLEEETHPRLWLRFDATAGRAEGPDEYELRRLELREPNGRARHLRYRLPEPLPVREGATYAFWVQAIGGSPGASSLIVRDDVGLLFAAAAGAGLLKGGLPELAVKLLPATCPSRFRDRCHEAKRNAPLRFTHGDDTVTLMNGERGRVGPYEVRALVAQEVTYAAGCADTGEVALSWSARRVRRPD